MSSNATRLRASNHRCVVFLTGNEKQEKRQDQLTALVREKSGDEVDVVLICPKYSKNWSKPLGEFIRALPHADAAVIGTYLPTELGKAARAEVRRRGIPHVRSSALGCGGLSLAGAEALGLPS